MRYSIIIPVYNRKDEIKELLESLVTQSLKDFEVLVVEDGSKDRCEDVVKMFENTLDIHYYYKENSGPGQSRNYGAERAKGDYFIVLDSDVSLPDFYLQEIENELQKQDADAFGTPDKANDNFTDIQKAISYSMTSFFTTGGIRGGKKKMDKFYPRSYSMGVRKDVWQNLGGFAKMRFGEDIDFSTRIFKSGYTARLFPNAYVYHKRRTDFKKFFRQVFNSGIARINLYKKYPETLKIVHLLPAAFTMGVFLCLLLIFSGIVLMFVGTILGNLLFVLGVLPLLIYSLLIFFNASHIYKSPKIGFLSVTAAFTQLLGYGLGFCKAWYKRCLKGQDDFTAFDKVFYK